MDNEFLSLKEAKKLAKKMSKEDVFIQQEEE